MNYFFVTSLLSGHMKFCLYLCLTSSVLKIHKVGGQYLEFTNLMEEGSGRYKMLWHEAQAIGVSWVVEANSMVDGSLEKLLKKLQCQNLMIT